ncbi:hypothetical protein I3843_14G127200 [Carya illinoinensis]|nr:hypothetical protein I3843_14G127200 [Carya illinoinensis]
MCMIMAIYSCWASPPTGLFPFGQEALRNLMKTNGAWTYRKRGMGSGKEQPSTQTSSSSNPPSVMHFGFDGSQSLHHGMDGSQPLK